MRRNPYAAGPYTPGPVNRPAAPRTAGRRWPTWLIVVLIAGTPCWAALLWGLFCLAVAASPVVLAIAAPVLIVLVVVRFRTRRRRTTISATVRTRR